VPQEFIDELASFLGVSLVIGRPPLHSTCAQ
jgi:hypothetical protein